MIGGTRNPTLRHALLAGAVVTAIAAAVSYGLWDRAVAEWVQRLDEGWRSWAGPLSELGLAGWWIAGFAIAGAVLVSKRRELGLWMVRVAIGVAASGLLVDLIKIVVARARPKAWFDHVEWGFYFFRIGYDWNGFPSGHSTTAATVAAALCMRDRRWWPVAVTLWAIVAWARVFSGSHYPSDVIVGAYVGVAVMIAVERWGRRLTTEAQRGTEEGVERK